MSDRIMVQDNTGARPLSYRPGRDGEPLLRSAELPWSGAPLELHEVCANESPSSLSPLPGEYHLRVVLSGNYEMLFSGPRGDVRAHRGPGSLSFHGGARQGPTAVFGSAQALVIKLDEDWLGRVNQQGAPHQGVHMIARNDATARGIAEAMCREVAEGAPTGPLFAESLSISLLSYALHKVPCNLRVRGGLTDDQCRRLRSHIQERLATELRLLDLAALCGLQPRHFSMIFRRAFGTSPHRYVVERRLERGAELLAHSGHDIAEIALQVGFSNQSHFTTAFRKRFGVTPKRYASERRCSVATPRFDPVSPLRPLPGRLARTGGAR